jgi:hypothetical protein
MNARETLIRSVYALKAMSQNDMEKLVDAYAHELAEQIRAHADATRMRDDRSGLRYAAFLIDPEVSKP